MRCGRVVALQLHDAVFGVAPINLDVQACRAAQQALLSDPDAPSPPL
jgi:hypothetical protein